MLLTALDSEKLLKAVVDHTGIAKDTQPLDVCVALRIVLN